MHQDVICGDLGATTTEAGPVGCQNLILRREAAKLRCNDTFLDLISVSIYWKNNNNLFRHSHTSSNPGEPTSAD